jgi:hypothetical protein
MLDGWNSQESKLPRQQMLVCTARTLLCRLPCCSPGRGIAAASDLLSLGGSSLSAKRVHELCLSPHPFSTRFSSRAQHLTLRACSQRRRRLPRVRRPLRVLQHLSRRLDGCVCASMPLQMPEGVLMRLRCVCHRGSSTALARQVRHCSELGGRPAPRQEGRGERLLLHQR